MARPDKVAVVEQVREELESSTAAILTEYRGLDVPAMQQLRAKLREAGGRYRVAKNTLIRIAAKNAGMAIPDEALTGPTAVAFTGEDLASVTKALRDFAKDHDALVIKGGVLEGTYLDADETIKLADLESREELLASLAGLVESMAGGPLLGMFDQLIRETYDLATAMLQEADGLFAALEAKQS